MQALFVIGCVLAYLALGLVFVFLVNRFHDSMRKMLSDDKDMNVIVMLFWPIFLGAGIAYYPFLRPLWRLVLFAQKTGAER